MKPTVVNRRWFSMKATEKEAEIAIFDEIGGWGISVSDFKKELDAVKDRSSIKLLLNSPGGDFFAGMAIYNLLAPMKDKIDVRVLGLAASVASIVALAGKTLAIDTGAYYMIHDPWAFTAGTSTDLRKRADLLDQIGANMADIYSAKSIYTKEEVQALMAEETWLTALEAVDAGFADEVVEGQAVAALACDISKFNYQHLPEAVLAKIQQKINPPATARDLESTLRDVGYSRTIAAGIVSKGFSAVRGGSPDEKDAGSASTSAAEAPTVTTTQAAIVTDHCSETPFERSLTLAELDRFRADLEENERANHG